MGNGDSPIEGTPQEKPDIIFEEDVSSIKEVVRKQKVPIKEIAASKTGYYVLGIFGIFLITVFVVFVYIIYISHDCPDQMNAMIDALVKILDGLGKFSTAVFAPLLAFILGYYFSTGKSQR